MSPDRLLRALADETRLRCIMLLAAADELCVCEITSVLDLAQPKISRHLALLRESGLVTVRRDGLWMHYRINPALPGWARQVIDGVMTGSRDLPPFVTDRSALARSAGGQVSCAS